MVVLMAPTTVLSKALKMAERLAKLSVVVKEMRRAAQWAAPKVAKLVGSLAGRMARPLIDVTVDSRVDSRALGWVSSSVGLWGETRAGYWAS